MTNLIIITILFTLCLTLFVTMFCLKYIQNLRQNCINLSKQNKSLEQKIISLDEYWKNYTDAREQNFVKKLRLFEINQRDKILVNKFDDNFLTIHCYLPNSHQNLIKPIHYQKQHITYNFNIVDMDYEHIEQILSQKLAEYLIKEEFVKGKYIVQNNEVKFYIPIMHQIT